MFTGIVREIGTVRFVGETASGSHLEIACAETLEGLAIGDSVSVAGACLTVVERDDRGFAVDVVPETLARTTLGKLGRGTHVNLEPAVRPTTALGGHFVQGHVDAAVQLLERHPEGAGARMRFALPKDLRRQVVRKGFITVDGVSLTIAALDARSFEVALIPHTAEHTTLGGLRDGQLVNVETDVIGKYVERLMEDSSKK